MSMLLSMHCPPIFRLLIVAHGPFWGILLATYADHVSANYWNILEYQTLVQRQQGLIASRVDCIIYS
jgi:hypothetical protein